MYIYCSLFICFYSVFQRVSGKTRNNRTIPKNTEREPYRIRVRARFCIVPAGLYRFSPKNPYSIRPTIKFPIKKALGTIRNKAQYNVLQRQYNAFILIHLTGLHNTMLYYDSSTTELYKALQRSIFRP